MLDRGKGDFMASRSILVTMALAAIGTALSAQPRKMTSVGGAAPDRGKCTVEVVVDGSAEVEIRGDTATLRNLGGASPQWRRFECTGPLPANPGEFRFEAVDGRGRQQLLRDPRNGGSAVARIDDPSGGAEGYTFDIVWGSAAPQSQAQGRRDDREGDRGSGRQSEPPRDGRGSGFDRERGSGFERDRDSYHSERDDAFRAEDWRRHLFARIREDLDHVQDVSFAGGGDQYRIERARQQLNQLQDMQDRGRYNRRQLDDVILALGRVVADNRLANRDRELLNDDLNRLRDFRANVRDYGVR